MIPSMTGFAAVGAELPGVALAVELRSVNHRYLDLQVRLPNELRALEGAKVGGTLGERCEAIETQLARVVPRIPAIHATYFDRLAARLRDAGLDPDQDRLKQELAVFATKVDVAEELSRLTTHISE